MADAPDPTVRTMLALAAISYLRYDILFRTKQPRRRAAMSELIDRCSATAGWKIVWGPCGFPPKRCGFDQELMYVAQSPDDSPKLAIAIRGTNPPSLKDWLKGDFDLTLKPWNHDDPSSDAKISASTMLGLDTLRAMRDPTNGGQTIKEFLRGFLRLRPNTEICVTGHSKGGPLSSTLALWLAHTQKPQTDAAEAWDPEGKATVLAYSFAGPTAGNAAFAAYSDSVLRANCHRVWNKRDIAPRAFIPTEMDEIPNLYKLNPLDMGLLRLLVKLVAHRVDGLDYKQVGGAGSMFDSGALGLWDVVYEHLDSYLEQFGLINEMCTKTLFDL